LVFKIQCFSYNLSGMVNYGGVTHPQAAGKTIARFHPVHFPPLVGWGPESALRLRLQNTLPESLVAFKGVAYG
jgi:hypothetical protein